jgi:hypothetical protein
LKIVIAKYLARPWLRHSFIDWVLIDMITSCEICAYGEAIKQQCVPGKRDGLLPIHHKYFSSGGNLRKMAEVDWSDLARVTVAYLIWAIAAPVGAIWAAFYFGYTLTGSLMLAIYACAVIIYLGVRIFGWCKNILRRVLGRPDPRLTPFLLSEQMYEVWRRFDGPVVNPTRVRDAMAKSSEKNAVWDEAAWSLIDRVVAIDASTWVVQPSLK